jgi:hypothetical protein
VRFTAIGKEDEPMGFVSAYRKDTGEKVRIPAHWLGHKTLGRAFNKTPRQRASDNASDDGGKSSSTSSTPAAGDKKE